MDENVFLTELGRLYREELAIRHAAANVHAITNQIYGVGHEYAYHLNQVAFFTAQYLPAVLEDKKDIIPVLFGAYFHDSIEDARLTYNDVMKIAKEYMTDEQALLATEIVYALTNEKGRNRHERANEKYYAGIRETKYAPLVKAADRMANYEYAKSPEGKDSMRKAYEKEMEYFIGAALTGNDGKYLVPDEMVERLKYTG